MLTSSRRWCGALLAAALTAVVLPLATAQPAAAEETCSWERSATGKLEYRCTGGEASEDDPPPDGSSGRPRCDLSLVRGKGKDDASYFCEGEYACFINFPSSIYPDPEDWPEEPPTDDSVYTYKGCFGPEEDIRAYGDWGWFIPDEPTIEELAWEAYGRLVIPEFTLAFNPDNRAIIYLDTWWWADGPGNGDIRGSSAAGLVAIAEPNRLEVDPGDGSGVKNCAWVTAKSDTCTHEYQKASAAGYPARARLVYDVRFENNGAQLDVPGLPETLESDWHDRNVPVHEVQAIVR
jgi:hypothetical protein